MHPFHQRSSGDNLRVRVAQNAPVFPPFCIWNTFCSRTQRDTSERGGRLLALHLTHLFNDKTREKSKFVLLLLRFPILCDFSTREIQLKYGVFYLLCDFSRLGYAFFFSRRCSILRAVVAVDYDNITVVIIVVIKNHYFQALDDVVRALTP